MVSSKEILKQTGIKSGKTLTRWHQRGLIPKPDVRVHPTGNGKMAFWPDWVLRRCVRIKTMVANGRSLDEIGQLLVSIEEQKRHPNTTYFFKEANEILDVDNARSEFVAIVSDKVVKFSRMLGGFSHELLWKVDREVARRETIALILKLTREGFGVVLVITGDEVKVKPDFVVSHEVADDASGSPLIVIPISAEIRRAFSSVYTAIPNQPSIRPEKQVVKNTVKGIRRMAFKITPKAGLKFIHKPRMGKK